jgi:hypothetical protein
MTSNQATTRVCEGTVGRNSYVGMRNDFSGLGEARAISDILYLIVIGLFPAVFESVDEHHFLKS